MKLGITLALSAIFILIGGAACSVPSGGRVIGGQPVSASELPTFPGASELKSGESKAIDVLFKEAQSESPPFIGLGIEVRIEQRTFRLPQTTSFADVKSFYADKLQSVGWREDGAMRVFTTNANAASSNLQGGIWVRVDQTLLIALATNPANGEKELLLSLAMH